MGQPKRYSSENSTSATSLISGRICVDGMKKSQGKSRVADQREENPVVLLWRDHHLSTAPTRREGRGNSGKGKECSPGRLAHCVDDRVA